MAKKRVLICDDSLVTARQLTKILIEDGAYEVVGHAKNGLEAIKLFQSEQPEIVLMDLVMPEMDGLQATRNIARLNKDAKIVVISSAAGVGEKAMEALKMGASNVLAKPFVPETVLDVLGTL